MIIKKVEVKGAGKKSAIIEFEASLNVVAGASDTGKSYIIKCFQFIFGADAPPKPIEQASGYTHLEVTFETNDKKSRFTLSRELREKSDITCIELTNNNMATTLKPSHKGSPNLSRFFLDQFNLGNKVLAKGKESMNHSALTLRILEKIFLVDETRIISESSPLGKGQNTEKTQELSLLKTLLTGEDDSKILDAKEDKISKTNAKQKLDNLEDFLRQFFPSEEDAKKSLIKLDEILQGLEITYEQAEEELNQLIASNNLLVTERNQFRDNANSISRMITNDDILIGRFRILEKKYLSDRERLEANSEAVVYIEQQKIVNCPMCGSELTEEKEIDVDTIIQGNMAEIIKLDKHIKDLRSTIRNTENFIDKRKIELTAYMNEVIKIDALLEETVGNKLKVNRKLLRDLDLTRSKFRQQRDQEKKRQNILEEIGRLQVAYDGISDTYKLADFSKETKQFSEEIKKILVRWGFPNGNDTVFDIDTRDIVVGGKPRSHFGKGYRAICFAAIIIGLMEYLIPKGRHPGFIILDSPLTTYRKRDESVEIKDEEVFLANDLIYAFYRDLCDYYKNSQIIIFDNQEPDEYLHSEMNYIHFSKNENIGRYGFFPIN